MGRLELGHETAIAEYVVMTWLALHHRLFQIAGKGRMAAGYDADFTIVDLKRRETVSSKWIESRCGWTPYDGLTLTGWPVGTLVRGRRAMWDGEILGAPAGEPVRFLEALATE